MAHRLDPTDSGGRDITHLAGLGSGPSHQSTESSLNRGTDAAQPEVPSGADHRGESSATDEEDRVRGSDSLRQGTGRIIRDETGAIVDVILAEEVRGRDGEDAVSESMEEDDNGFEIEDMRSRHSERVHGQEAAWLLRSVGEAAHGREDERTRAVVQGVFLSHKSIAGVSTKRDKLTQNGGSPRASLRRYEVY